MFNISLERILGHTISALLFSVACCSIWTTCASGSEKLTLTERRDIQQRVLATEKKMRTSFHVLYQVTHQPQTDAAFSAMQQGSYTPGEPYVVRWRGAHAFDGMKSYHKASDAQWSDGRSLPSDRTFTKTFDGQYGYSVVEGIENRKAPYIQVYRDKALQDFRLTLLPEEELYFELVGLKSSREGTSFTFSSSDEKTPYALSEILVDESFNAYREESLLVLEKPGRDKIWLAPVRNYAILKRERNWENGTRCVEIVNSRWISFSTGHWMPIQSEIKYFHGPGDAATGVAMTAQLKVEYFTTLPDRQLFESPVKPESEVFDTLSALAVRLNHFTGMDLDEVLDAAVKKARKQTTSTPVEND